jgi:hypothetical protein
MDYIRGGWELSLSVAIDYTASNGELDDDDCLHKMGPSNMYEAAINSIGSILEQYDTDKMFPVYGFGGKPNADTKVNHCFPLTGDPFKPYVQGVEGILGIYRQTLPSIKFSGPTYFAPLLQQFYQHVKSFGVSPVFHVMLILTDGVIHDMSATK